MSTMFRGGRVLCATADAQALLVDGEQIAWIGSNDVADGLAARADRVIELDGALVAPGFVDAHVRTLALGLELLGPDQGETLTPERREAAYRATLALAASQGIVAIHEMSAPAYDKRSGLKMLHEISATGEVPLVVAYRAEPMASADDARTLLGALPFLAGIGGGLEIDGVVGEHTAAMRAPYLDLPNVPGLTFEERHGRIYLDAGQIAAHLIACHEADMQAGFQVVGDRGMDEIVAGFELAATQLGGPITGATALRGGRHRIEHALFVDFAATEALLRFGVSLSLQPTLASTFGGSDGLWARRLGVPRACDMSPIGDVMEAGIPVAFGSAAPITALDPWSAVRAAVWNPDEFQRVNAADAFRAHTVGGRKIAGGPQGATGELTVGQPADLAVWRSERYGVGIPTRFAWHEDRETLPLPDLSTDAEPPTCLITMRAGRPIYDALD